MSNDTHPSRTRRLEEVLRPQLAPRPERPDEGNPVPTGPGDGLGLDDAPAALEVRIPWAFGLTMVLALASACGSGGGDNDPDPDPPPGGTLAVTAVSDLNPWLGDTITVTGTGFSTTPNQNFVRFPTCTPSAAACVLFEPEVLEATATRLVVRLPHFPMNGRIASGTIRVAVAGVAALGPSMTFRIPVAHRFVENHHYHFDPPYLRANDSLEFWVQGFDPTGGTLTIDGTQQALLTMTPVIPELGQYRVTMKEPPRFMGTGPLTAPDDEFRATVRVTSNGRNYTSEERAYRVPRFSVGGITPNNMTVGSLQSVTLAGETMPGSITLVWTRVAPADPPAIGTALTNGCASFCNSVSGPPPPGVGEGTWGVVARFTTFGQQVHMGGGTVIVSPQ